MSKVSVKKHLKELQWRFLLVAVFFIAGACIAYQFQSTLIPALLNPLGGQKLVYLNPAGGFSFIFLISIYAGLAFAIPVLIQQLYAFIRPTLPEAARKKSPFIIIGSFLLLLAGVCFGYFVAVPNALTFLYAFADQYVVASLTADSYLNFIIAYTIGIGIVFQLPMLLMLIHAIKPFTPGGIMKSEKWVVLIAFVIAALITPTPDPINQAIIAGPVIVVYQIGVVAVLLSIAKVRRKAKRAIRLERKANRQASTLDKALKEMAEDTEAPRALRPALNTAIQQAPVASSPAATPSFAAKPRPVHFSDIKPVAKPQSSLMSQLQNHADISHMEPEATAQLGVIKTGSAMDGFVRRPANLHVHVPSREAVRIQPTTRPQATRPTLASQRAFIDGISAPKRAVSF